MLPLEERNLGMAAERVRGKEASWEFSGMARCGEGAGDSGEGRTDGNECVCQIPETVRRR